MSAVAFQMPEKVSVEKVDNHHGTFIFAPLEKGYGVTMGNALRRVLLSSLEGYAVTSVKVPGVQHEFSTIPGIKEDLVELILNLKQVRFKTVTENVHNKVSISLANQEVFKAGDIARFTPSLEIINPDFVICHLDTSGVLELELTIERGRSYIPAEENKSTEEEIGLIPIDAIFTPIKHVSYKVEYVRVGQKTDYEKLILDLQTDGSIHPEKALERAASVVVQHFSLISEGAMVWEAPRGETKSVEDAALVHTRKLLQMPLVELGLSVRAFNCLKAAGIRVLGDLAVLEISEMVKFRNFGKKSLKELEGLMVAKGLSFGMDITKYGLEKA